MNESRRGQLNSAIALLHRAESIVDHVCDEERDSMDNMPENLQSGDRYVAMENAVSFMEDALESIQEAARNVEYAINER